jgi:uncharacterized protein YodC (DUF2158 family)
MGKLEIGDAVFLKNQDYSPRMTVNRSEKDHVFECSWFDTTGELHRGSFDENALIDENTFLTGAEIRQKDYIPKKEANTKIKSFINEYSSEKITGETLEDDENYIKRYLVPGIVQSHETLKDYLKDLLNNNQPENEKVSFDASIGSELSAGKRQEFLKKIQAELEKVQDVPKDGFTYGLRNEELGTETTFGKNKIEKSKLPIKPGKVNLEPAEEALDKGGEFVGGHIIN